MNHQFLILKLHWQRRRHKIYFVKKIQEIEGYRYVNNGGTTCRKSMICSKSYRKRSSPSNRKRQRDTQHRETCNGSIIFSYKLQNFYIKLRHDEHHGVERENIELSDETKARIFNFCDSGLSPFQIASLLRAENEGLLISYDQIYNTWTTHFMTRFKRDSDPLKSCVMYLEEAKHLKKIYRQSEPFGVAFVTNIGLKIVEVNRVEEILIDSTYKTNKQRLELFVVMGLCFGDGFPIAYFLLEAGTTGSNRPREESLSGFQQSIRGTYPRLPPSFFFY